MRIGYARVSTLDQNLDLQLDALKAAGCKSIYQEQASGAKTDRKELAFALENLREGDTLVVWKLDRVGRSLKQLIAICSELADRGITFVSLTESIDTTTNAGRLMFNMLAVLSEFERGLIKERSAAGRAAARARGITGGRARSLQHSQVALLRNMAKDKTIPLKTILTTFKISKSTYYGYLKT